MKIPINHPAYMAWKRYRISTGYTNRIDSWYAGWLAFMAGWEANTNYD